MSTIRPTNRTYTEYLTSKRFVMHEDTETKNLLLISPENGEKVKHFCASAFHGKEYRLKNKEIIKINTGEFFRIDKNNPPTHERFFLQQRFKRL